MRIEYFTQLNFELLGHKLYDIFIIVPNLNAEVVIGVDTMQKFHIDLSPREGKISVLDPNAGKLMLM